MRIESDEHGYLYAITQNGEKLYILVDVLLTYNGETKTLAQWADAFGICYSTFMSRYDRGWSIDRIATTPTREYGKERSSCRC